MTAGGTYCPLSPLDPPKRLNSLINQSGSRLVIIHASTSDIFEENTMTVNIGSVIHFGVSWIKINVQRLSLVLVSKENITFMVFTSGSTGGPKAVFTVLNFVSIY